MNAVLNLYDGCESEEPIKTFTCRRLTVFAADKLEEITERTSALEESKKGKTKAEMKKIDAEITAASVEILQTFFPSFTAEDFAKLDPYEYQSFCLAIGEEVNKIRERALKN